MSEAWRDDLRILRSGVGLGDFRGGGKYPREPSASFLGRGLSRGELSNREKMILSFLSSRSVFWPIHCKMISRVKRDMGASDMAREVMHSPPVTWDRKT